MARRPDDASPEDREAAPDGRLDEEIRFHIDQQTDKLVRQGLSREQARRKALMKFGGVDAMKDSAREELRGAWLRGLGRDLRFGVRGLLRARSFATLAIFTLGLGIAASTSLFSVVEAVLLRDLPYPEPDRIVRLLPLNVSAPDAPVRRSGNVAEPNVLDWRQRARGFEAIALMSQGGAVPVVVGGQPLMARWTQVSNEFFDVMGASPARGRRFGPDELVEGGPPVALVGVALRARTFGDELPPGATLRFGSSTVAIIGEMPAGFDFPGGTEIWTPEEQASPSTSRTAGNHQAIARLADGMSFEAAQADLSSVTRAMKSAYGDDTWMVDAEIVPLLELATSGVQSALKMLFAAAVVLFIIACTNVTNLLLARDSARAPEVALQLAIGAGRWRIVRQRLAETFVLSVAAAGVGVLGAALATRGLLALDPGTVPRLQEVGLNWTVASFACVMALAATAAIGLVAALRSAGGDLRSVLADAGRSTTGGRARERVRQVLVVTQVALTLVLLNGAALLGRSFAELTAVDPGFRTGGATVLHLVMPFPSTPEAEVRQARLQQDFMFELARLPGVTDVGLVNGAPTGGGRYADGRYIEMTRVDEIRSLADVAALGDLVRAREGHAGFRVASGGYFAAMGIPLHAGRVFDAGDTREAPHVAVVSQSLADERWPGRDPIGRFIQFGNMDGNLTGFRVVGVVGDVRELTPEAEPGPLFYVDHRQRPRQGSRASIVLAGAPEGVGVTAQRILRSFDANLPLRAEEVADAFDGALSGRRFNLLLSAAFGAFALGLAVLGTYGLMSYLIAQRTREIGIRLALGASPAAVVRLIVASGTRLAAAGIVVGLGAVWLVTGLVAGLLYGVSPADPVSIGGVVAMTGVAVVLASLVPARRASRISPTEPLRA